MKRYYLALTFVLLLVLPLSSQQLTRFAVVDLTRIYTTFYRDSKAVRDFEERSARVQADVNRMTAEIQVLQRSRIETIDQEQILRLESEIYKKSEFLREFYRIKMTELAEQKKNLTQSSDFLQQMLDEIKFIAESEGYSMVLSLKEGTGIIWNSPTVDISDLVIQSLMTRAGR